ncbi:hypothetical protein [Lentzea guizhouensis]|uniref:hypothetical protein n=1 Tax=Lentzea guizhouensis TaxID=1586287 RepID=UPI0012B68A2E|nr:hypothetical protein [Lentzea guizhouensis]
MLRAGSVRNIGRRTGSDLSEGCSVSSSEAASTASVQTSDHDGVLVAMVSGELDMISVDAVGTTLFDHLAVVRMAW